MPLILKQCRAIIDSRTTVICLQMHGVAVPVEVPFETMAGDFQQPPFHIHCRTLVSPAIRGYVSEARREANAELQRRPKKERKRNRTGNGGSIPKPTTKNPPSGYSFAEIQDRDSGSFPRAGTRTFKPVGVDFREADRGADAALIVMQALDKRALRPSEREALFDYIGSVGLFRDLNARLRDGTPLDDVQVELQIALDRLIGESVLPSPIVVYRGLSKGTEVAVGTTETVGSYLSTSLSEDIGMKFADWDSGTVLELLVPAGTNFLLPFARDGAKEPTSGRNALMKMGAEAEVLLGRGHRIRYVSEAVREVEGLMVRVVRGEILPRE